MAYNNYFPMGYYQQQYPQQPFMPQVNQQQQVNNTIIWVNSEAEAQNYPVAPNNAVALWDSSKAAIYLKQADASGRPSFKAFDLVEHKIANLSNESSKVNTFIEKADLDDLKAQIEALMAILKQEGDSKKRNRAKSEVMDNE